MTEQTNTDPPQEPVEEPNLDELLAEYQEPETPEKPEPAATPTTEEMSEFRSMMDERRVEKQNAGLNEAAKMVKTSAGEVAANIPDWMLVGAMREEATRNPKIEQIFNERDHNPDAWNKVATALGKKIAGDLTPTDKQSTESWNAVESAVHSASSSTPQPESLPDFNKMSDLEFQAWKMENG